MEQKNNMKPLFDIYDQPEVEDSRFILGKSGSEPLLVIGLNPSKANSRKSDPTTKKVEGFAERKGFKGFIMVNLYPQRATNPDDLDPKLNKEFHKKNIDKIRNLILEKNPKTILAAWGEGITCRYYLWDCLMQISQIPEIQKLKWKRIGSLLKSGHPRHPSRPGYENPLEDFDLDNYLAKGNSKYESIIDEDHKLKSSIEEFEYQKKLTTKLDDIKGDFNQSTINEIVLWKINRYAGLDQETFNLLNNLPERFDPERTREILRLLINTPGIQLPMASTILRFKNPKAYQIIDQRAYRVLYGTELKISNNRTKNNIEYQIDLYFKYLVRLKEVTLKLGIPIEKADRILYLEDKELNKKKKLKNY